MISEVLVASLGLRSFQFGVQYGLNSEIGQSCCQLSWFRPSYKVRLLNKIDPVLLQTRISANISSEYLRKTNA